MFTVNLNNDLVENLPVLVCPCCTGNNLHPRLSKSSFPSQWHGKFILPTDKYEYYDRGYISITFECETCNGDPELVIYNHKGLTHFVWHSVRKEI